MKRFFGLNVWLAALIVAGIQSAALGYMIVDRAGLLQDGREIVLDVKPVDPRSLFRGDYVILNYGALSRIEGALLKDLPDGTRTLYVTARKVAGEQGAPEWKPVAVSAAYPVKAGDGDVVLRGSVPEHFAARLSAMGSAPVDYGIEAYFVPEGEGKRLEKLIGEGEMRVVAAIGTDGRAAIKGIEAKGERVYEERIW
ncbi:MAG: GDYXXLXY domain-containing protein [Alphaproteobacteria bacterium]|nr:GDYXXLXY domain-containing protein [Alphaproteobacteria bacterium]